MFVPRCVAFLLALFLFCIGFNAHSTETVKIAPHTFTIPDGYTLKRVAAPPLVKRPIHMCFDVNGDLYVTDSSGNTDKAPVQLRDPQHRLLRLIDRDGDGVFDESKVFADELPFPEGILVHQGSVYVGAPPHIWKLRDTDGDHVADERTIWFDGGSIEGCGNDMHGPYLGQDGFFYWCKGAFAPQEHELTNGKKRISRAAHIYRARPDGSQLERVITGGMNNPVGLAFSETGERFLSGTFFDLSQPGRRDGILHAVYGGMYGRENKRVLAPHPNTVGLLPILTQLGPAAPSGMLMPKHQASGLRGNLVCTEFNTRRLSRHQLSKLGSSHSAITSTFLESDQSDFHPTDVIEDADGSLLIADTGSWYMICCPTSKIAKPDTLGAIYRIKKVETQSLDDPRGLELDWNEPQVSWLADSRPAVRCRAITNLADKKHIETLREVSNNLNAIWTLNQIPHVEARSAIREVLASGNTKSTKAAIHSVALWRDDAALTELIKLLSAKDPQIQRLSAMALGRLGRTEAIQPLLDAYANQMDPFLRHAITYALYEIGSIDRIAEGHPIAKRLQQMIKLDGTKSGPSDYPEIKLAKVQEIDPAEAAYQKSRLDELAIFLPNGDSKRGQKLFNNQDRSKCVTCHLKDEAGVRLGPDLTRIGAIRSERDLLEAIVFPNASIARYHETINILTKDETLVSGLLVEEKKDRMVLASAEGVLQAVKYKDIAQARYSTISMMPKGLDKVLTPTEIADLVAYLRDTTPISNQPVQQSDNGAIPEHRPITVPGLHAYSQKSVSAGEEIEFRVSSDVPYEMKIVKLGSDPESREQDAVLETFRINEAKTQAIHPGSYVHISNALPEGRTLTALTLEVWARPFNLAGWQGLITQHDYPENAGIGLFINQGGVAFVTDNGGEFNELSLNQTKPNLLKTQRWQHIVGTWDGKVKRIFIDGKMVSEQPFEGTVRPGKTALRIGSYGSKGASDNFYNGDIAMVSIYDQALSPSQIQSRVADQGLTIPKDRALLACWPFTEERGTLVGDAGLEDRHGRIINHGTWMIGGPSFDATRVGRHDTTYDPTQDPQRGHGLRLSSDELYNARWETNHRFHIPAESKSGIYAGQFDFVINGEPKRYYSTFIVRRNPEQQKAPVLVLVSSNTWLAYNSAPFPVNHGRELTMMSTQGLASSHPGAPAYSCYRDHQHGQPTYKIGMKLPWPAAGPNKTYINQSYSHLMRGERFLHLWLDQQGYEYDVITDRDLDRNPEVVNGYEVVAINGHSEYWSARAYNAIEHYLQSGGDTVVLSGNTMFWRVSYGQSGDYMECRKYGTSIGGRRLAQVGELYHSDDFKRGSLMRFCGYPAWKLIGLTCIGWGGPFKPYEVEQSDHFLFNHPNPIDLKKGQTFGWISEGVGAVGHEFDVRLSTLQRATADPVVGGLVEPKGIVTIASSKDQRRVIDFNAEGHKPRIGEDQTIAEMIYWERPQGGRVFHTGSIATAWGVYHDESLSSLLKNVLHHFDVKPTHSR